MRFRVSAPGVDVSDRDVDQIEKDLEKLDRRLREWDVVNAEVRINAANGGAGHHVVLELDYGHNHLVAKADNRDYHQAVREARDELLRQVNDRGRGGHSDIKKR